MNLRIQSFGCEQLSQHKPHLQTIVPKSALRAHCLRKHRTAASEEKLPGYFFRRRVSSIRRSCIQGITLISRRRIYLRLEDEALYTRCGGGGLHSWELHENSGLEFALCLRSSSDHSPHFSHPCLHAALTQHAVSKKTRNVLETRGSALSTPTCNLAKRQH